MLRSKDALRIVPHFILPQSHSMFAYREGCTPLSCICHHAKKAQKNLFFMVSHRHFFFNLTHRISVKNKERLYAFPLSSSSI